MAIQIGDEPERVSLAEKLAPWLRRIIIGGALVWICSSMQNFYEDTRSHTIKVVYPLLLSREKITAPQPGYDPQKAVWKPVSMAVPVMDNTIFYVKTKSGVYAVKIWDQTLRPERAEYQYVKAGTSAPVAQGVAGTFPAGIPLPGATVGWSAKKNGEGFLYLDDAFIWARPPLYTIAVSPHTGELAQFRNVPSDAHFESVPWKIARPSTDEIIPMQ